jgi:hypothetical protein
MKPHRVEMLIAGLLVGSAIGILLSLLSDYGWSLSLHNMRLNADIFMNQYLGKVLLLCVFACLYAGIRLIILSRPQRGAIQT